MPGTTKIQNTLENYATIVITKFIPNEIVSSNDIFNEKLAVILGTVNGLRI